VDPLVRSRAPKRPKLSEMEVSTSQFQWSDRILANDKFRSDSKRLMPAFMKIVKRETTTH